MDRRNAVFGPQFGSEPRGVRELRAGEGGLGGQGLAEGEHALVVERLHVPVVGTCETSTSPNVRAISSVACSSVQPQYLVR